MGTERPNILLITTDQQRFDTIHALGNKHIFTPHLNWLVGEGITYTRCYADAPVCMSSRATIMTGKCGYSTGLTNNSHHVMPMRDNPTLPGLLTRAGYQTRAQGKMHFHPMRCNYGFETMELPADYYRKMHRISGGNLPKNHGIGENELEPTIGTVNENQTATQWVVRRSIDFIETRDTTRPFFLWSSFAKPHPPLDPSPNFWSLYQNMPMPDAVKGDWSSDPDLIPEGWMRATHSLCNTQRFSPAQIAAIRRAYYACITEIDYTLGLLFAKMREMNLMENTWIVFTADHGEMLGDHHLGSKCVFFEGSAHLPFIIRPPRPNWEGPHPQDGTTCNTLVSLADVMPTILNLCGVSAPRGLDGCDLLKLATKPDNKRPFYGMCDDWSFALIEENYKYMWSRLDGCELLFDLASDPMEKHDLIAAGTHKTVVEKMRKQLHKFLAERKHPCAGKNGKFKPYAPGEASPNFLWPGFCSTTDFSADVLH